MSASETKLKMQGTIPVVSDDDAIASTAPATVGDDALPATGGGETESHGDGVPRVVSAPRPRRGEVAVEIEGVSP
jgi:hypothetical protein